MYTRMVSMKDEKRPDIHLIRNQDEAKESDSGRILLIDDEEIILSSLQRALQRSGYEVITVKDSMEALEIFRRGPDEYDLIITDQTMPQITGVELGKRIMEIRSDIPIILCTGFSDTIGEQEVKDMGFQSLLIKPAGTKELKAAVQQAMQG
jgi:two-component system, cell cycle sensor histidine kinase and response regulator CckA